MGSKIGVRFRLKTNHSEDFPFWIINDFLKSIFLFGCSPFLAVFHILICIYWCGKGKCDVPVGSLSHSLSERLPLRPVEGLGVVRGVHLSCKITGTIEGYPVSMRQVEP